MFTFLEGMARDNAKMIDENEDLHITHILDGLDSLYGVSMTFQSLNTALCGLQQKPMESAHAYYNHRASPYKYWNEDALSRWLGTENLGWAILDSICTRVLVDNGARVNSVMLAHVCQHNLGVSPISELDHSLNPYMDHIPLVGLGGGQAEPLGFTLMKIQIEGMPHYDEHQVLFILDEPSAFSTKIPVILGTPTINRVVQTMKETEMHNAPVEWQTARVTYEWVQGFQFCQASLGKRLKFPTNTAEDPLDLDEKVLLTDKCTIPGFQSIITHGCTQRTMMMGNQLDIMTQAPYPEDKADLPNGLYVMRTYTELKDGSQNVSLVLRNLRGWLIG